MQDMIVLHKLVEEFHVLMSQPVLESPDGLPLERGELRIGLMQEELEEFKEAFENNDKVEQLDALCDETYVVMGCILECGFGDIFIGAFKEVHRSNMSKADDNVDDALITMAEYNKKGIEVYFLFNKKANKYITYRTEDDKVLKSHKYSPANLKQFFNETKEHKDTTNS